MEAVENIPALPTAQSGKSLKILGIGFGLAISVGATVRVGILRNSRSVAAQLNSVWLIMLTWTLGGVYCLGKLNNKPSKFFNFQAWKNASI
jgi:hypothetical protein